MPGRPALDPLAYVDKICGLLRRGNYMETAAVYAGVHKDTLYAWLKRAHDDTPDGPYRLFSDAIALALAEAEARDVQRLDEFGDKNWQVVLAKLERRFNKNWGLKSKVEHTGADGGPIKTHEMSAEELEKEEARLNAILGDDPSELVKRTVEEED